MAECKDKLKSLWIKVKQESEKTGLKLNIQKMKSIASGPITSWQIDGETMEIVTDFLFQNHCSPEIKRCLLLDNILKSRDITLLKKVLLVKATVFLVVIYGCESWTIKKAEC